LLVKRFDLEPPGIRHIDENIGDNVGRDLQTLIETEIVLGHQHVNRAQHASSVAVVAITFPYDVRDSVRSSACSCSRQAEAGIELIAAIGHQQNPRAPAVDYGAAILRSCS